MSDPVETLIGQLRFYAENGVDAAPCELLAAANELQTALSMREALRPFANFAADNTEPDYETHGYGIWAGNRCERERIRDWFGPTDFHRVIQALSMAEKPQ